MSTTDGELDSRISAWAMEHLDGTRFIGLSLPSGDYTLSLAGAAKAAIALTEAVERANDLTALPPPEPAPLALARALGSNLLVADRAELIRKGLEELGLA